MYIKTIKEFINDAKKENIERGLIESLNNDCLIHEEPEKAIFALLRRSPQY